MTKVQYIQFRIKNNFYPILYYYYIEKLGTIISFNDFNILFNQWLLNEQNKSIKAGTFISKEQGLDIIIDDIISYYDKKFEIMYLIVNQEVKIKKSKTLIL